MSRFNRLPHVLTCTAIALASFTGLASAQKLLNVGPGNIGTNNIAPPPPPPSTGLLPACPQNSFLHIQQGSQGPIYVCIYQQVAPAPQPFPQPAPQPFPQPFPQPILQQFSQAHYAWCIDRYRSYRPETNSYTAFSGETRYCNSPHN